MEGRTVKKVEQKKVDGTEDKYVKEERKGLDREIIVETKEKVVGMRGKSWTGNWLPGWKRKRY